MTDKKSEISDFCQYDLNYNNTFPKDWNKLIWYLDKTQFTYKLKEPIYSSYTIDDPFEYETYQDKPVE